jgi:hypothetical protein
MHKPPTERLPVGFRLEIWQMTGYPKDIEAEITFLRTEEGGRRGPAVAGYRPQFYYDGQDWVAVQHYGDVEAVLPGQTVLAYLAFLSPECHVGKLYPGKEFLIREGERVVAQGHITRILDLNTSAIESLKRRKLDEKDPCDRGSG